MLAGALSALSSVPVLEGMPSQPASNLERTWSLRVLTLRSISLVTAISGKSCLPPRPRSSCAPDPCCRRSGSGHRRSRGGPNPRQVRRSSSDLRPDPHRASRRRQHTSLGIHPGRGRGTGGDAKQTGWGAPGRLEDGGLEGSSALDTLIGPLPWTSRSSQPPAVMVLAAFDCLAKRESKEKEAPMPRRAGMLTWALHRRGGRCDIHPIERTGGTAPSD